jgi:SAM-dependent methyltransferase
MDEDPRGIVGTGYDAIAERYEEATRAGRGPETYFRRFLDRVLGSIPNGGWVLDLGCGAGLIAAELARHGRVVGVDRSAAQLRLARHNAPTSLLVRADLGDVTFAPGSFDMVVAFWSVIHVPRELHRVLLERIRGWLRSEGVFAATLGAGDNPEELHDFHGTPMYWSHFDADTNRALLRDAGFEIVQADEIEDEGETSLWVIATA